MLFGYLFSDVWILSVTCIGISNSLFHVAGGKYVTDKSGNDISHLGIFVSTGAVGLVLGQRYFEITILPYVFFAILLISGVLFIFSEDGESVESVAEYKNEKTSTYALLAVIAVVVIRSFVGKVATADFTATGHIFLFISVATALGKAMGGIFAKLFGIRSTTCVSMLIAAVCLTLGNASAPFYILGVFAFNFSMPITLYYANVLLKGSEGFAFGTLAASLVPGYFLAMSFTYTPIMRFTVAILCIISMLAIIVVSKRIKDNVHSTSVNDNY
jgi:FSR family fosmidomycin resistance protein-like MFS transporter